MANGQKLQDLLDQFRDQKFRNKSDAQLEGYSSMTHAVHEQWANGNKSREAARKRLFEYTQSDAGKMALANAVEKSRDPDVKKRRMKTKLKSGQCREREVYEKIYAESWTPDRGEKLYQKLSEKYNVPYGTVHTVVNGTIYNQPVEGHAEKLKQWKLDHGNHQWWWKIVSPDGVEQVFETQSDAGRWICSFLNKPLKDKNTAGGTAYVMFKHCKPKTRMSGVFAGYCFIKINRKTGEIENKKADKNG